MGNTKISIVTNLRFVVSFHSQNRSCKGAQDWLRIQTEYSKATTNQFCYNRVWQLRGMCKMAETRINQRTNRLLCLCKLCPCCRCPL